MICLGQQRRFKRRLLQKISRRSGSPASTSIGSAMLLRERHRFLGSHAVQCATLHSVWVKSCGEAEADVRWKAAQALPVVPRDYRRFRSAVEWYHKPRRTLGFRKICRFSDTEQMWHLLARDLIVAQHIPRPHIADWRGRGRDAQIAEIIAAITSGHQAVVCADIRRAFASVNIDVAYDLPFLPELLIRRAIDHRTHRFIRRERSEHVRAIALSAQTDLEVSPSGLLEGSPASNAIFSVLLDDLPDHMGEGIQTFTYCDNIILLAPSLSQAQQAEIALVEYFTNHRAGPFEIISSAQSVSEPFEHLGYELQWQDGMEVRLSTGNWIRFMNMLERGSIGDARGWLTGSFGHCSPRSRSIYAQIIADEDV